MFEKIFVIEDTQSDIKGLVGFLSLSIEKNKIIIIDSIENALDVIEQEYSHNKQYAAFIDIYWNDKEKGIDLAQTIRKKHKDIKLVAFTKSGLRGQIEKIQKHFDAFIDKNTNEPNACAKIITDIKSDFLDQIENGYKFFNQEGLGVIKVEEVKVRPDSYFFSIAKSTKTAAQLIIIDFARFSKDDDDIQLANFDKLRNSLYNHLSNNKYIDKRIVFLPTGDGVAIGIVDEEAEPVALQIVFGLLENLRTHGLDHRIRVGVHYGRIFLLEGEKGETQLIGPGINKAARLEAASSPGKVLVSTEYHSMFLDRSGGSFSISLTCDEPQEFEIKGDKFKALFISKGKLGQT